MRPKPTARLAPNGARWPRRSITTPYVISAVAIVLHENAIAVARNPHGVIVTLQPLAPNVIRWLWSATSLTTKVGTKQMSERMVNDVKLRNQIEAARVRTEPALKLDM